ncbi:uncharacterized protein PG986_004269 [Apiospora aurea]|uniref:AAA+ ATPase lid domain-containing protein n=1 Tax=Apiospora aurea TaxID=335848 RepID=A0ABR1QM36_9PEZI
MSHRVFGFVLRHRQWAELDIGLVFLRVLEYYAGVLFLTTNRVGDFDEAFTSRIHISLYYPELNCDKTIKVFNINIKMIEERFRDKGRNTVIDDIKAFAEAHYSANEEARWKGRQIRNACQTALALAEFEAQGNSHTAFLKPDAVVHLKVAHFETVQKAYLDFDKYMNKLYGSNTGTRAQEGKVRAILDPINENTPKTTTGSGAVGDRKEAFRNAARAKAEPHQEPAAPATQPALPQPQSPVPGQFSGTSGAVPPRGLRVIKGSGQGLRGVNIREEPGSEDDIKAIRMYLE